MLNYCKGNEFDLHKNTRLALKLSHVATRKWAIHHNRSQSIFVGKNSIDKAAIQRRQFLRQKDPQWPTTLSSDI